MERRSGIYAIRNSISGGLYVGSTHDMHSRWNHHRSLLNRSKHSNRHLQAAWTKYGASAFVFEVIEQVRSPVDLAELEQRWIDALHPSYNITRVLYPVVQRSAEAAAELVAMRLVLRRKNREELTAFLRATAPKPLLTKTDVASLLRVSEKTVERLEHDGKIKRHPFSKQARYTQEEIDRYLAGEQPPQQ